MPEAELRGRMVSYRLAGSGPLLVLLHGIGGGAASWRHQLTDLADTCTVAAWDLPVYDAPAMAAGQPRMTDYADDLAAFLDHLDAPRAHVLGISLGGVLALEFYRRYAARVLTLGLADSYCGGATVPEPERSARLARRLAAADSATLDELARARAPELFSPAAERALVREAEAIMAAIPPLGYRQRAIALAHADARDVLPYVAVPTLVLWGEHDIVLPRGESEILARGIRGAEFVVLPAAGHASNQEQPAAFNGAVRRFLRARAGPDMA